MYTYSALSFGFGLLAMTIVFGLVEMFLHLGSFISKYIGDDSR